MNVLITGSSGLIGSAAAEHFERSGHVVMGIDNNLRLELFGAAGDTSWNLQRLLQATRRFRHFDLDVRDRARVFELFSANPFDLVVHCAAQPSHDKSAQVPLLDFDVNCGGTLNILEATRLHSSDAVFVLLSTNKVYGDSPNRRPLVELSTRWDYALPEHFAGIDESCPVDRCLHSPFGASKLAADVMTQEYGLYFGMKTGVFRCGCITGPYHAGVELHGFLSYLVDVVVRGGTYTIHGHKGKQVRDVLCATDVVWAIEAFASDPKPGEVYNLGGGRSNSVSVVEAIEYVEQYSGNALARRYRDVPRRGDHVCYVTDMRKFRSHFPTWSPTVSVPAMLDEMIRVRRNLISVPAAV